MKKMGDDMMYEPSQRAKEPKNSNQTTTATEMQHETQLDEGSSLVIVTNKRMTDYLWTSPTLQNYVQHENGCQQERSAGQHSSGD